MFDDPLISLSVSLSLSLSLSLSVCLSLSDSSSAALAKQLIRNVGRRDNVRVKYTYLPSKLVFACGANWKKE